MFTHFFYDITHFDGSFFVTLKDLLFRPGFLSKEYMLGKRKKYLHPVRMYVFTSAVFFLVFFSMFHVSEKDIGTTDKKEKLKQGIVSVKEEAFKDAKSRDDSARIIKGLELLGLNEKDTLAKKDSLIKMGGKKGRGDMSFTISDDIQKYRSVAEYDSVQKTLSSSARDGAVGGMIMRKLIVLNQKYEGDQRKILTEFINKFLHSFPYLLFVSLPLYALFLKLLYIRHRKEYFFADHGVFLIHLYIFTFLFLLLYFGFDKLEDATHWTAIGFIEGILVLTGIFYALRAMKNFYRQSWGKTILKFIIFNILCLFSLVLLFTIFLAFSFYQI